MRPFQSRQKQDQEQDWTLYLILFFLEPRQGILYSKRWWYLSSGFLVVSGKFSNSIEISCLLLELMWSVLGKPPEILPSQKQFINVANVFVPSCLCDVERMMYRFLWFAAVGNGSFCLFVCFFKARKVCTWRTLMLSFISLVTRLKLPTISNLLPWLERNVF